MVRFPDISAKVNIGPKLLKEFILFTRGSRLGPAFDVKTERISKIVLGFRFDNQNLYLVVTQSHGRRRPSLLNHLYNNQSKSSTKTLHWLKPLWRNKTVHTVPSLPDGREEKCLTTARRTDYPKRGMYSPFIATEKELRENYNVFYRNKAILWLSPFSYLSYFFLIIHNCLK